MRQLILLVLLFSGNLILAQFEINTLYVGNEDDTPALDPSVLISRKNPEKILISTTANRIFQSSDNAETWKMQETDSEFGVYGSPELISDGKGQLYYFHLSDPGTEGDQTFRQDRIICQSSKNMGEEWAKESFLGYNPPTYQIMKSAYFDRKSKNVYVAWTRYDEFRSMDPSSKSHIMFSSSSNGKRWEEPVAISHPGNCLDDDGSAMGAVIASDKDGKIYAAYALDEALYLDRSFDKGKFWLRNDIVAAEQPGGWRLSIPGVRGATGLPSLEVDRSSSVYSGMIYMIYTEQPEPGGKSAVKFVRSNRGGDTWSQPIDISPDPEMPYTFFPAVALDEETGVLCILYYSMNDSGKTDIWLGYTLDAGAHFSFAKLTSRSFDITGDQLLGKHPGLDVHDEKVAASWVEINEEGRTELKATVFDYKELAEK